MSVLHGTFVARLNRFVAIVRLADGVERRVHVASSGRMKELLVPGAPVVVHDSGKPGRKTAGLLAMVRHGNVWVSVDTSLPGKLLRQTFTERSLPAFAAYTDVRPEYTYGESRLDFLLTAPGEPPCLIEVKSVTSVLPDAEGTPTARFPDAPTARGTKHLLELARARQDGYRTAVCFVAQRADAQAFGPWDEIDPEFGRTLRAVAAAGVEVYAWRMEVTPDRIRLGESLPVRL